MKQILFLVLIPFHLETVLAHITWKLEGIMRIGKTMTLTCTVHNVDTIDQQLTRQWSKGGDLISYNGHSTNPSKYTEILTTKNEFSLLIKNLTLSDVTSIYQCLYSFGTYTKGLAINSDNFEYPPNDETTEVTYTNTDDGHPCLQLHFSQVYPLPHCRIEIQGKQFDFQDISVTNHTNYIDVNFTYVYEQDIKCGLNPKIACQLIELYPVHIEERTPCTRNTSVLMIILIVPGSIILIASIMLCIWCVRRQRKPAESMMQGTEEEQEYQPKHSSDNRQQSFFSNRLTKKSLPQTESVITSSMITPPTSAGTSVISGPELPRNNMFHYSPYTTPTKTDPMSQINVSCMSCSEPKLFSISQTDRKCSPMVALQRPGSTPLLSQNSMSKSYPESSFGSFSQRGYETSPCQSKTLFMSYTAALIKTADLSNSAGLSESEVLSNSPGLQSSSGPSNLDFKSSSLQSVYQTQYQSGGNQYQSSQNHFQTGQNQFFAGQNQFPSGKSQYGSSQNYSQFGITFQSQPSSISGNQIHTATYQNNQNGLSAYPNTQSQTGTCSGRRGNSSPGNQSDNSKSGDQNPSDAYPGSQTTLETSNLFGNQNQGSAKNDIKNQGGSYSELSSQRGSYNYRQTQNGSTNQAGSYSNQPSSYTGGSSFNSVTDAAQIYSANRGGQSFSYQASVSNGYQGQSPSGSIYHQGRSTHVTSSYQAQVATRYGCDSQAETFSMNVLQSSSSYHRDVSSSGTQSSYTSQTLRGNANQTSLQPNLRTSPLSANKLGASLSKMTVKNTIMDSRLSPSQI